MAGRGIGTVNWEWFSIKVTKMWWHHIYMMPNVTWHHINVWFHQEMSWLRGIGGNLIPHSTLRGTEGYFNFIFLYRYGYVIHLYPDQYSQLRVNGDEASIWILRLWSDFLLRKEPIRRRKRPVCQTPLTTRIPLKQLLLWMKLVCICFVPTCLCRRWSGCYPGSLMSPICPV